MVTLWENLQSLFVKLNDRSLRGRGRPRTTWLDNVKTWTGLSLEEVLRATEDRTVWWKVVHDAANPWTFLASLKPRQDKLLLQQCNVSSMGSVAVISYDTTLGNNVSLWHVNTGLHDYTQYTARLLDHSFFIHMHTQFSSTLHVPGRPNCGPFMTTSLQEFIHGTSLTMKYHGRRYNNTLRNKENNFKKKII